MTGGCAYQCGISIIGLDEERDKAFFKLDWRASTEEGPLVDAFLDTVDCFRS